MSAVPPVLPANSSHASRIGLLGGTFNPIHRCHLALAREMLTRLQLDQILFIPTGDPPHKSAVDLAPAEDRLAMVRLAIADEPRFASSDLEVRRPGRSYSIETVTALQASLGHEVQLFFGLGLDAFLDMDSWRRPQELLAACHFVVVSRPGAQFSRIASMALCSGLDPHPLQELDSGRRDTAAIALPTGRTLHFLTMAPCPVSASLVRERLRQGLGGAGLLPHSVERYIIRRGLYQERAHPSQLKG